MTTFNYSFYCMSCLSNSYYFYFEYSTRIKLKTINNNLGIFFDRYTIFSIKLCEREKILKIIKEGLGYDGEGELRIDKYKKKRECNEYEQYCSCCRSYKEKKLFGTHKNGNVRKTCLDCSTKII